jgi:hypothetical protein
MNERRYLKNVTPKTLAWYRQRFQAFETAGLVSRRSKILAARTPLKKIWKAAQ